MVTPNGGYKYSGARWRLRASASLRLAPATPVAPFGRHRPELQSSLTPFAPGFVGSSRPAPAGRIPPGLGAETSPESRGVRVPRGTPRPGPSGFQRRCRLLDDTDHRLQIPAASVLERLRLQQIRVHLDDFGTGYSSLSHLHQLPIDTLKIDRSFTSMIGENGDIPKIVKAIINLGHSLQLEIVAEGIETETQLHHVATLGCEFGQGMLLSKPLTVGKATDLLESNRTWQIP